MASKLIHAESSTGTVHLAYEGHFIGDKYDPYCNQRSWIGDYWGKKWKKTDKPVTCKRCLASAVKAGICTPREAEIAAAYKAELLRGMLPEIAKLNKSELRKLQKEINKLIGPEIPKGERP